MEATMRRALTMGAGVAVLAAAGAAFLYSRAEAVEEPPYKLVDKWGACELRDYPELVVAETRLDGPRSGENGAFRTLAGYIFGANAASEKIAMTAPVLETPGADGWTMRFTMPQGKTLENLPAPKDSAVRTRVVPPARVAAIRFSGWATQSDLAAKAKELEACLKTHGLTPAGPAALAQYDPPWILGPWRRNEAMIPVS
jgi:hypothetical protein